MSRAHRDIACHEPSFGFGPSPHHCGKYIREIIRMGEARRDLELRLPLSGSLCAHLRQKPPDHGMRLLRIAAAEQVGMIQHVVDVVQLGANRMPRRQRRTA